MNLIKATQPFEQISIDFKGPLLSVSKNKYLLVIVNEFSRFPFAYACPDIKSATVIEKLAHLFSIFGFPGYANDTNLSLHFDDTESTILPQSDNESNSFSQPDITSNGQAAPDDTESMSSDAPCETPNLRRFSRIRRPIDRYGNNIYF